MMASNYSSLRGVLGLAVGTGGGLAGHGKGHCMAMAWHGGRIGMAFRVWRGSIGG